MINIIAYTNDQLSALNRAIESANNIHTLSRNQFGGNFGASFGRDIMQTAINKMKDRVNDLKIVDELLKKLENLEINTRTRKIV